MKAAALAMGTVEGGARVRRLRLFTGLLKACCGFLLAGAGAVPGMAVGAVGDLTQKPGSAGCISAIGNCLPGVGLTGARSVTVSPDGANVYAVAQTSDAITVFDRAGNGALTQKPGGAGCISQGALPPCADGVALDNAAS